MAVRIELNINDDSYKAFRDLMCTNSASIVHQIAMLEEAIKTELDITKQNYMRAYISNSLLQLAVITHILDGMPEKQEEKSRLILPNGNP